MKLSDKREEDLYNSIATPIMDLRVENQAGMLSVQDLDSRLYDMQKEIWKRTHKALNLKSIK